MTWAAPWAFAGLALLAIPVLIHLLGPGRARARPFPSLRFIDASRLQPHRRTRLHDAVLLAVRLLVLAAAVLALARPILPGGPATTEGDAISRVVIVDTSSSMARLTPAGEPAVAAARALADSIARDGGATVLQAADVRVALAGAAAWLSTRTGSREAVVISDFQAGTIDSTDIAGLPATIAVRALRVPVRTSTSVVRRFEQAGADVLASAVLDSAGTIASWSRSPVPGRAGDGAVSAAVSALARPAGGAERADDIGIIVAPRSEAAAARSPGAGRLAHAWQGDLVTRLQGDSLLTAAVSDAEPAPADSFPGAAIVARNARFEPVVVARSDRSNGRDRLQLILLTHSPSPAHVGLAAALARNATPPRANAEFDEAVLSEAEVTGLERAARAVPAERPMRDADAPSFARWLWLLALALLAVEWAVRSRRSGRPAGPTAARAATTGRVQ